MQWCPRERYRAMMGLLFNFQLCLSTQPLFFLTKLPWSWVMSLCHPIHKCFASDRSKAVATQVHIFINFCGVHFMDLFRIIWALSSLHSGYVERLFSDCGFLPRFILCEYSKIILHALRIKHTSYLLKCCLDLNR